MASTEVSATPSTATVSPTVRMRISARDDIKRDIEEWAKPTRRVSEDGTVQSDQSTVIGGQLKDNVTEQRLLESRLFDLSRERYKFMVQLAWQRKAFLDKQKRKTSMMRDLLKGVDTTTVQAGKKSQSERLQEKTVTYKKVVDHIYGEKGRERKEKQRLNEIVDSLQEKKLIFPKPIATASFSKKRIFQTEVPKMSATSRSFPMDKRKVVFPDIPEVGARRTSIMPENGNRRASTLPTNVRRTSIMPNNESRRKSIMPSNHAMPTHPDNRTGYTPSPTPASQDIIMNGRQSVPLNFMRQELQRQSSDLARPSTDIKRHSVSAGSLPRFLKYRASYDTRFSKLEGLLTVPYDGSNEHASSTGVDDMSTLLLQLPPSTPAPTISATPLPS